MKRVSVLALLWVAVAAAAATPEARVIVRFKAQADSVRARALAATATASEAHEVAQTRATALGLRAGAALAAGMSLDERTQVVTATGLSSAQLAARLAADAEVELVAVDGRRKHTLLPDDPLFGGATVNAQTTAGGVPSRLIDQWYLKAPASVTNPAVVSSVNAPAAWDLTTGTATTVVAVLDTGIRRDHPDLAGQVLPGYDFIGYGASGPTATAIANRPAGADLTQALDYGDWVSQADIDAGTLGGDCTAADIGNSSWHGTRVSGLIAAASNNGQGMAGVGWGLKILPLRVLGKCGGYDSDIIAAMKWAVGLSLPGVPANANKAKVLNMSLGGSGACGTTDTGALYRDVIAQVAAAGATVVVAAGNSEGQAVGLPGNCPGVVTVTALRHVGTKVGFASLGPEVTVAAPGGNCININAGQPCLYPMVSMTNSGTTAPVPNDASYTGSAASVGTSFSAPIVSGIVGLMASLRPALTPAEATQILKSTARAFPTTGGTAGIPACAAPAASTPQDECYCSTSTCGAGMVDAGAAMLAVQALNGTPAPVPSAPSGGGSSGGGSTSSNGGGGGGGGAANPVWLAGLLLAALLLGRRPPRGSGRR